MSISQKSAWIQFLIFAGVIVGWMVLFAVNGTVFYWLDETMKMTFYYISAAGFAALVTMNLIMSLLGERRRIASDERDKAIWRRASLWATAVSYTTVAILLLLTSILYMKQSSEAISVYFPLFIVVIGGVTLLLTQSIVAIVLYGRNMSYA